jgi:hypothetical protein
LLERWRVVAPAFFLWISRQNKVWIQFAYVIRNRFRGGFTDQIFSCDTSASLAQRGFWKTDLTKYGFQRT